MKCKGIKDEAAETEEDKQQQQNREAAENLINCKLKNRLKMASKAIAKVATSLFIFLTAFTGRYTRTFSLSHTQTHILSVCASVYVCSRTFIFVMMCFTPGVKMFVPR